MCQHHSTGYDTSSFIVQLAKDNKLESIVLDRHYVRNGTLVRVTQGNEVRHGQLCAGYDLGIRRGTLAVENRYIDATPCFWMQRFSNLILEIDIRTTIVYTKTLSATLKTIERWIDHHYHG